MSVELEIQNLRERVNGIGRDALVAKIQSEDNTEEIRLLRDAVLKIQIKVASWSSLIGIGSAVLTALILKYIG